MEELPTYTPEQLDFASRIGKAAAPLVNTGMDLRDAERAAARMAAATMVEEGAHAAVVEQLLQDALERSNVGAPYRHDERLLSDELQVALGETYRAVGGPRLPPDGLLVEKRIIGVKTGYPMFVFPNESKHPGNPHVTVIIGDEKVNVTISEKPKVIAGNMKAVGIRDVLKAVKKHRVELMKEWDETRPDDQKLENSKAHRAKAACEAKG
ncbi:DUF4160 domain-containing protein [uncultured Sphingomonas sp.]|uniref:DUF4160 domain-containing protein n=1 Tax=uncultured Sphingomonas sp. TaxID=158754 RepID=UPI002608D7E7|nr:DUF4160 domain-containing protein [uncultured Sphingomonas sp.]